MDKVRLAVSSLMAAALFGVVVGAHGCSLNPFADISFEEAQRELAGPSSSSSGVGGHGGQGGSGGMGGVGGMGGSAGTGGVGGTGGMLDPDAGPPPCFCKDDNNDCTTETVGADCPNGEEAACHLITPNVNCDVGMDKWCSDKGECRDCRTCDTGECTDRCNGVTCSVDGVCKSGICVLGDENLCCDTRCASDCDACNRFGAEGTCVPLPKGATSLTCQGGKVCNGGVCVSDAKAVLGASCSPGTSSQCASGVCRGEYCRSDVNQPCIDDVECGTNLCVGATLQTRKCKSCVVNSGQCHEGSVCDTMTGYCKAALGQPATVVTECADSRATLSGFMCVLPPGATCNAHAECASRNCMSGVCSALCTMSGQCLANTTCNSTTGTCGLLTGSYCVTNDICYSGKCTGFPRRCQ